MRRILYTFAGALMLAAGCQLIGGIDGIVFVSGDGGAGAGGASTGGSGGGPACQLAKPPTRPDPALGTGGDLDIILALRSIDLGEAPMPGDPPVGLDLDDTCTCPEQNPCRSIDGVNPVEDPLCDGPGGRDNNLRHVLETFKLVFGSQQISDSAEKGKWSIIFRIGDYNGEANDDRVRFSVFATGAFDVDPCRDAAGGAGGMASAGGAGGIGGSGGDEQRPEWDGTDVWPVLDASLVNVVGDVNTCVPANLDLAKYNDNAAYVSDHVLVGSLGEVEFVISRDQTHLHFRLSGGFVSGRLQQDTGSGQWTLSGAQFVGQFSLADQFRTMGELSIGPASVCVGDPAYSAIKTAICESLDLNASLPGPTRPCTGTSLGMLISAVQAHVGGTVPDPHTTNTCLPGENPANDSCDAPAQ